MPEKFREIFSNKHAIFARAKRGRVVESEYEKANCRPTDTATLEWASEIEAHSLFETGFFASSRHFAL